MAADGFRVINLAPTEAGVASYTLSPGESFLLRAAAWIQNVSDQAVDHVPTVSVYDKGGELVAYVLGPKLPHP